MATLALRIRTNFAKAEKDLQSMGAVTDAQAKKFEKFNKAFSRDNIDKWSQSNRRAIAAIKATRGPLEAAAANQANLERKIQQAIRGGINPQDKALRGLRNQLVQATKRSEQLTRSQGMLGLAAKSASIGIAAGAAAVGLGAKSAISAYSEYSSAIADIDTLTKTPISPKEYEELNSELRSVSRELGIQRTELAGGVYQAVSAGITDLGEALKVTETAARLSTGATIENEQSVRLISAAVNAYASESLSAAEASDVFFQIVESGVFKGQELAGVIGRVIPLASNMGISFNDVGAALATMTQTGVLAAETATQLKALMTSFIAPTKEMEAALASSTHQTGEALLANEGLAGALEFLIKTSGGSSTELKSLLGSTEALAAASALSANDMKNFNSVLSDFADVSGATDKAVKAKTEGHGALSQSLKDARVAVNDIMIEIGQALAPAIIKIVKSLQDFIDENKTLIQNFTQMAPKIVAVTAAVVGLGVAAKVVLGVVKAFKAVSTAITAAKASLNIIANPMMAVIGLIAAAVIAIVLNWDKVKEAMQAFGKAVGRIMTRVGAWFRYAGAILKGVFIIPIRRVEKLFADMLAFITDKMVSFFKAIKLPDSFIKPFEMVLGKFRDKSAELEIEIASSQEAMQQTLQGGVDSFLDAKDDLIDGAKQLNQSALDLMATVTKTKEGFSISAPGVDVPEGGFNYESPYLSFTKDKDVVETVTSTKSETAEEQARKLREEEARLEKEREKAERERQNRIRQIMSMRKIQWTEEKAIEQQRRTEAQLTWERQISGIGLFKEQMGAIRSEADLLTLALASMFKGAGDSIEDAMKRGAAVFESSQFAVNQLDSALKMSFENRLKEVDYWKSEQLNALQEQRDAEISYATAGISDESRKAEIIKGIDERLGKEKLEIEYQVNLKKWEIEKEQIEAQKFVMSLQLAASALVAAMKALEQLGPIAGPLAAIGIGLASAVALSEINKIKPGPKPQKPSFQTGGRFVVPGSSISVPDRVGLRVNPGETIDVTPRGVEPMSNITVVVQLDSDVLFRQVQRGIDAGDIIINRESFTR